MATFLKNINLISRSSVLFLDRVLAEEQLKGCQSKYILYVCGNPGVSQDNIARMMFVNKSNVARQLNALEEGGFIERRSDVKDRRISLVYPTERALSLLPVIRAANAQWRGVITEGFTEEEKEQLLKLTEKLYENAVRFMEDSK